MAINIFGIEEGVVAEPFESILMLKIVDNQIYRMKWIYDTLDVFTTFGAAVYNQDDQELVDKYIANLKQVGLLR